MTLQALAAVLGGTQSLHTNSMDEALALPTEKSVGIALKTQQVIAFESGVTDTIDPFGGSYVIEALTDEIERQAFEYIKTIDELGGMLPAIEKGYVQKQVQDASYEYQLAVEKNKITVVGVNQFQAEDEKKDLQLLRVDAAVGTRQIQKLQEMKQHRDNILVNDNLAKIRKAALDESENLMPHIIEAVRSYATEGEICGVLREIFGEYKENIIL